MVELHTSPSNLLEGILERRLSEERKGRLERKKNSLSSIQPINRVPAGTLGGVVKHRFWPAPFFPPTSLFMSLQDTLNV
jgi:hypothetical protein